MSWVDKTDPAAVRVVFYEMLWVPIRDEVKNRFLACFESHSVAHPEECKSFSAARQNTNPRTMVNGTLKDKILVGGFADAMIVLSPVGDVLRDDVSLAICIIASDVLRAQQLAPKQLPAVRCDLAAVARGQVQAQTAAMALEKTAFFAMTHSLGSFLLLDAQEQAAIRRAKEKDDMAREILAFHLLEEATVFMNANQVSLLRLGRLTALCKVRDPKGTCPNRTLRTVDSWFGEEMPLLRMTKYVAFNDVDDLLGFELPPYLADVNIVGPLINVSVRNPGLRVPGLFKHPGDAHTHQDRNPAIIEAIVEGFNVPAR